MTRTISDEFRSRPDGPGKEPYDLGPAECSAETARALNVTVASSGRSLWIPKSVVHDNSEVFGAKESNSTGKLIVQRWFAEKENLVRREDQE